jgi:hypothetical protein
MWIDLTSVYEGYLFTKYFAVSTTSIQNSCVITTPLSMLIALSINIMFILSMNPFFVGYMAWYFGVLCHTTCKIDKKNFQIIHHHCQFSKPNDLICLFFHKIFKLFEFLKTSDFFLIKYIHVFLEKSSMKET